MESEKISLKILPTIFFISLFFSLQSKVISLLKLKLKKIESMKAEIINFCVLYFLYFEDSVFAWKDFVQHAAYISYPTFQSYLLQAFKWMYFAIYPTFEHFQTIKMISVEYWYFCWILIDIMFHLIFPHSSVVYLKSCPFNILLLKILSDIYRISVVSYLKLPPERVWGIEWKRVDLPFS